MQRPWFEQQDSGWNSASTDSPCWNAAWCWNEKTCWLRNSCQLWMHPRLWHIFRLVQVLGWVPSQFVHVIPTNPTSPTGFEGPHSYPFIPMDILPQWDGWLWGCPFWLPKGDPFLTCLAVGLCELWRFMTIYSLLSLHLWSVPLQIFEWNRCIYKCYIILYTIWVYRYYILTILILQAERRKTETHPATQKTQKNVGKQFLPMKCFTNSIYSARISGVPARAQQVVAESSSRCHRDQTKIRRFFANTDGHRWWHFGIRSLKI